MKAFMMDGYVCGEVQTRYTNSGKGVTSFSVNSPDRRKNPQTGEWESVPQFFRCEYWHRGERDCRHSMITDKAHVVMRGYPRYEEWQGKDGKRSAVKFVADDMFLVAKVGKPQDAPQYAEATVYDPNIPF